MAKFTLPLMLRLRHIMENLNLHPNHRSKDIGLLRNVQFDLNEVGE